MSISKRKIVALVSVMLCVICLLTACSSQTIVKDFNSIADVDVKENTVAACIGTSAMKEAENTFKNAKVMEYNSYIDGIMAVQKGVLQGFALDQTALSYAMATEGIKDIKVLDENVGEANSIVAGVSKNTKFPNLVNEINNFLKKVHSDGTIDDMYQRWVVEAKDEMPQIHKPENPQGKLVVATTGLIPPFSYYKGDELTGMDIELINRLANYMNVEIDIRTYDLMGINSALEANQCDCIFSNLNATDERREVMDFSNPVYVSNTKLIVYSPSGANGSFIESVAKSFEKNFLRENRWKMIVSGIKTTIIISLASVLLGTLLGFALCMLNKTGVKLVHTIIKCFVRILQGTPIAVLLMIMYYIIFSGSGSSGVLVSIIAFSLNFAAYSSEIFRSGIDAVGVGQTEAALALGYTKTKAFFKIIMPQAAVKFLPVYKGEFISLVKMTSIVGYISVQDLTRMSDIIRSRTYEAFFPLISTAIIYFVISYILTAILKAIEVKIEPDRKNRKIKGIEEK
ncbi:MAG: ABC transporter substrate-binding protein/permease [Clostridia bacterium]|nr:ABC transporter substrate-binding protein/permease [Clostridia bacterium]